MFLVLPALLLAACTDSNPAPPTPGGTTAATSSATTPATTPPTSVPATSPPTTGATSGGASPACDVLDRIEAGFTDLVPDYEQLIQLGNQAIDISGSLPDQGQATLLATIGQDTADAAQAFLDGDFQTGGDKQNQVIATIGPARVAFGCS
jgi:hypothetical protein